MGVSAAASSSIEVPKKRAPQVRVFAREGGIDFWLGVAPGVRGPGQGAGAKADVLRTSLGSKIA